MKIAQLFAALTLLMVACGDSRTAPDGSIAPDSAVPDSAVPDSAVPDSGAPPDAGPTDATTSTEAMLHIHVRTNVEPFVHVDGFSGQTSRDSYQGVRSMRLFADEDDADPWVVFDHGSDFVEAGYNDGDDTVIASVPLTSVRSGRYRMGRTVVTHSRYEVDATMHSTFTVDGVFDNIQVLSSGTEIDSTVRPQGWFRYVFRTGGMEFPLESIGAPLPFEPTTTGGFRLAIEGSEAAYYYPLDIVIETAGITEDVHLVMEVNMDRAFRWEDQPLLGFTDGVFDTTPVSAELVRRFGANSLDVYLE